MCESTREREREREGRPALCHVRLIETHAECATSKAEPASEPGESERESVLQTRQKKKREKKLQELRSQSRMPPPRV